MTTSTRFIRRPPAVATAAPAILALLLAALAGGAAAQATPDYRNVTTGAPLRPGVYGRIALEPEAPPPPVIFPQPVIASRPIVPQDARPVYLYVPPGQVRKWRKACARWTACDEPVLFVRVDHSPSRWGKWRVLRAQELAQHGQD